MTNRLQVIASRLLDALVRGDGRIPGRASQVLAVLVGDVLTLAVLVALGQTEVNNVDVIARCLCTSNQKVVWLDITMDDALFVHFLDSLHQLDADQKARLQVEAPLARGEEVFERGAKQVHHHHVEVLIGCGAVRANVVEARYARYKPRKAKEQNRLVTLQ